MNFHIITLFPKAFDSYINESIVARAVKDKKIKPKLNIFEILRRKRKEEKEGEGKDE